MRLQDKVIIVTGSTTGIGKAIALRCVSEGASIVVNGLEENWGEALVEQIGRQRSVLHIQDINEEGAPQNLVDTAIKTFGRLDAVVNNAAWVVSSDIHSTDKDFLQKVLNINTIAPFLLIKAALPYLTQQQGSVLNIGSVNGWCGEPDLLAYSISKGALMTMTRNLGDTLHRENGVRVNQINPGWVLTENEIQRKKEQGLPEDWYKDISELFAPARRILSPGEIAAAAVYWLSNESGPVSGQVMELEQYPLIGRNPPKNTSVIKVRQ